MLKMRPSHSNALSLSPFLFLTHRAANGIACARGGATEVAAPGSTDKLQAQQQQQSVGGFGSGSGLAWQSTAALSQFLLVDFSRKNVGKGRGFLPAPLLI